MKDYQQSFLNLAIKAKALEFGEFKLKSGRLSPYFFNAANMLNGFNLYELAKCYVDAINDKDLDFDCIYGPAYKGIFLGSIVAALFSEQGKNYPLSFNRKEEKNHGEGGNIIGANPKGKVLIIDSTLRLNSFLSSSLDEISDCPFSCLFNPTIKHEGIASRLCIDSTDSLPAVPADRTSSIIKTFPLGFAPIIFPPSP